MFARRRAIAVLGCLALAGCGGAAGRSAGRAGSVAARPRLSGDVVILEGNAGDASDEAVFADAIEGMASAAIAVPGSREVILRLRSGGGEIAWLALPTEELWAAGSGASTHDDVLRHLSLGFGDARSRPRPRVAAARRSLINVDADGLAVRAERGELVIRIQMSRELPADGYFALWAELLGRAAAASPGASAYRLELAAGKLVVAKVVLSGRDAAMVAGKPGLLIDRLQLYF